MPSCCCEKRDHPEAPPVDYPPLFYQFKQHGPIDRSSSDSPVRAPESPVEQSSRSTEPISTTSLDSKPHGLNTHSIFLVKKNGRKRRVIRSIRNRADQRDTMPSLLGKKTWGQSKSRRCERHPPLDPTSRHPSNKGQRSTKGT